MAEYGYDPKFFVSVPDESVGLHLVTLDEDGDFLCVDCEANGVPDGYLVTDDGAQSWHDAL